MCSSGGEVARTDEALQKSQAAMTDTLNKDYSTTFAEQQAVLGQQQARLSYMASNPMGYSPAELHSATTSINENTARAASRALGSAAAFAATHGAADVGGGGAAAMAGEIGSEAAQSKAQELSSLSQQNEAMKRSNFWNAIQGLNSVGAEYGGAGGTAIGGAGTAAGTSISAGSGALAAKEAGWQHTFGVMSGIAGLASAGLGTAGVSSFLPKPAPTTT